ncbi:hypothetical protein ACF0H5_009773 [Mactra antiquata]
MKVCVIVGFLVVAVIVNKAYTEKCHGHDTSTCHVVCQNADEVPTCNHDTCTCEPAQAPAPAAVNCLSAADCANVTCVKNDESIHCLDNFCNCSKH